MSNNSGSPSPLGMNNTTSRTNNALYNSTAYPSKVNKVKVKVNNTQYLLFIYLFIGIRIVLLYFSTTIATNLMSQYYADRVLIEGKDPPSLTYLLTTFLIIDLVMTLILILILWGVSNLTYGSSNPLASSSIVQAFSGHYAISMFIIIMVGYIITKVMYRNKYFLYKDDGLRAIRSLQNVLFMIGLIVSILPFSYIFLTRVCQNTLVEVGKGGIDAETFAKLSGSRSPLDDPSISFVASRRGVKPYGGENLSVKEVSASIATETPGTSGKPPNTGNKKPIHQNDRNIISKSKRLYDFLKKKGETNDTLFSKNNKNKISDAAINRHHDEIRNNLNHYLTNTETFKIN
jgi:hypothetical protein